MKVIKKARQRAKEDTQELQETVRSIIDRVVEEGDDALFEYTLRFDAAGISSKDGIVPSIV